MERGTGTMIEKEMLAELIAKVGKVIEYHHELREDVKELKRDVAELKQDVAVLKKDVAMLKEEVAVLKEDVSALKEDVAVLKEDVAALKDDVALLNKKFDRLERRQMLQGSRLEVVEADVSLLQEQMLPQEEAAR